MLTNILYISQLVVSILLVGAILLQAPEGGLSPVFGGGGEMYRSRRNVEKLLLIATIVLAVILAILSLLLLFPQFNK
jgi:protein translocase SecG subunit